MNKYVVKYSGEISTKRTRTKWGMINRLYSNILNALKFHNIKLNKGKAYWDFIYLDVDKEITEILRHIPGIQYFSEVVLLNSADKEEIITTGFDVFKEGVQGKKFAVRCRNKLSKDRRFRSKDIEIELGAKLFDYSDGVRLNDPDVTCHVEIRDAGTFFYWQKVKGLGGFPVGNTGTGIILYSGGIDSPVAAYYAMRMGIKPVFVFFDLGGDEQKQKTVEIFRYQYAKYVPGLNVDFIEIPFLDMIQYIRGFAHKYQNLLLKYFFYKVAERLADRYKAQAVITGEALGQVSTQTIENIILLDSYISYSVFRPVLFMPKLDIIAVAEETGTMEMSYKGKEYCAIATKNVATGGRKDIFDKIIKEIDLEPVLDSILEKMKIMDYDTVVSGQLEEKENIPAEKEVVIVNLSKNKRYYVDNEMVMDLDTALKQYESWDKTKHYKIMCDAGVQSKILAEHMQEAGFTATVL